MSDHYKTLGVNKDATQDEIKKSFKTLAKKHHPDVGGDQETFQKINEAYGVLSDPNKRQEYDNPMSAAHGFGGFGGFSGAPDDIINEFFNQYHQNQQRGRDIHSSIELTLEEIASGTTKVLYIKTAGNKETLEIKIPPGTDTGARMRYRGKGAHGPQQRGDMIITIVEQPHPNFERYGNDIASMVEIDVWDALLGVKQNLVTVNEKNLTYSIPPGIQPNQKIKLDGQGICGGAHYIIVKITVPKHLTESQKRIIIDMKNTDNHDNHTTRSKT